MSLSDKLVQDLKTREIKKKQRNDEKVLYFYKKLCNVKNWSSGSQAKYQYKMAYFSFQVPYIKQAIEKFNSEPRTVFSQITFKFVPTKAFKFVGHCYLELQIEDNNYVLNNDQSGDVGALNS